MTHFYLITIRTALLASIVFMSLCQFSCRKFVLVETPPGQITQNNAFTSDRTANGVLVNIYSTISQGYTANMAKFGGLLADEFGLWSGADFRHAGYYKNSLTATVLQTTGDEMWLFSYSVIYRCNIAIEGLTNGSITPSVKKQLLGEAYFLRAWFYFYLVNLYGDLPLAIVTDTETNRLLPRSQKTTVYDLITSDLIKAKENLSHSFVDASLNPYAGNPERVRPNYWAATALLARVYLYNGNNSGAETEATKIINEPTFSLVPTFASVFLKNSQEAIWQIQPTDFGWNTREGRMFVLKASPTGLRAAKPVYISSYLINAFEPNDKRRTQWIDSFNISSVKYYFPSKYKVGAQSSSVNSVNTLTEYSMMLRLGEQYLIRAEAKAKQNNLTGAIADLDQIRNRATLPLIANTNPGISQSDLLDVILHERQVELFSEWAHRWFDLKRFSKVEQVMNVVTPIKGGTWETTDQLLPIPFKELQSGINLVQNPGYQ